MADIFSKWEELENQVQARNTFTPIFINVFSTSIVDLFIQNSLNKNFSIILHLNIDNSININREITGIKVRTFVNNAVDESKPSIIIENLNSDAINIFKAFSATLCENIEQKVNKENIEDIINETINSYKNYFSGNIKSLSEKEQQGLFGELTYLKEMLEKGNLKALDCWEGVFKNKHDFVFKNKSVEVKTTRNQFRLDIYISNENQLDNFLVNELNLVVYRLEKVNVGKTIQDLYNEIITLLPLSKQNIFKAKLIKVGMNFDDVSNLCKFKLVNKFVYDVNDDFPKIDKLTCGDRIFEVKYHISLDGINCIEEDSYNGQ